MGSRAPGSTAPGGSTPAADRTPATTGDTGRSWLDRLFPDAPTSDWALALALHRIADYDPYRAFLTRLGIWALLVIVFLLAPAPWWAWTALVFTPIQTTLEMLAHRHIAGKTTQRPNPLVRLTARTAEWASGRLLLNFTGVLGGVSTLAQLFAVLFALPTGGPSWIRPIGLALALAHLSSGLTAVLLDTPWYNAANRGPNWRIGRLLRRVAGPLVCLTVLAIAATTPWPGIPFPVVAAACAVPLHVFLKTRESDRQVRASEDLVLRETTAARKRFFDGLHGQLTGPVKMTSRLIAQHDPPVDPQLRELGLVLPLLLSSTAAMVDEQRWAQDSGRVSMREIVQSLSARSQVRTRYHELGNPDATSKDLVLLVLSNLIPNAAVATHAERQRLRRAARGATGDGSPPRPPEPLIGVAITAEAGRIIIEVSDPAPLVPPQAWCAPSTSLLLLAERLRSLGGDLTQHRLPPDPENQAVKVIRAIWNTSPHTEPDRLAHP